MLLEIWSSSLRCTEQCQYKTVCAAEGAKKQNGKTDALGNQRARTGSSGPTEYAPRNPRGYQRTLITRASSGQITSYTNLFAARFKVQRRSLNLKSQCKSTISPRCKNWQTCSALLSITAQGKSSNDPNVPGRREELEEPRTLRGVCPFKTLH